MSNKTEHSHAPEYSARYAWYVVFVLMLGYTVAFVDRQILSLLIAPIKLDLGISDTQIGLLAGFAFAIFYTIMGIPIARLSDTHSRRLIIAIGVFFWSLMTAVCGLAETYWVLFLARVGVGIGEACISPSAFSMMADYFPPSKLARAIGVYSTGLYVGTGIAMFGGSALVAVTRDVGQLELPLAGLTQPWQLAFFAAALPGLLVLVLLATVREPRRVEYGEDGGRSLARPEPAPFAVVARHVRDRWRIFAALAVGAGSLGTVITAYLIWIPELLRRTYGWDIADAGYLFGVLLVVFATPGPVAGGWLAGWLAKRGYRDAEMRAAVIGGWCMLPFAVVAPLMNNPAIAVGLLALLVFWMSFPQGLSPSVIQLIAPNHMRGQLTAFFMLIAVLSAYTIGPALVALVTDVVFRDETALRYSLSIVSAVLIPLGIVGFQWGLRPYAAARAKERQD